IAPAVLCAYTEHEGTLMYDDVWTAANSPHVLRGTFIVPAGRTLVVEQGAVVVASEDAQFIIDGMLLMNGTPQQRILVTGYDQNRWGGMLFESHSLSSLYNVTFATSSRCLFRAEGVSEINLLNDSLLFSPVADSAIGLYANGGHVVLEGGIIIQPMGDLYSIALLQQSTPINNNVDTNSGATHIDIQQTSSSTITGFTLLQNYPNPFNPVTEIGYAIPSTSRVTLGVYDVSGKEIKRLVDGEQDAGTYSVQFVARNIPSGIYFYRLQAGANVVQRSMLLVK
ncbi:MAG TPA: T9SS type A sorting domain-containing protein, partial [Candidatus Kapabacteria bacterium]|nr:T9SS type A sorting domain-containing protein [Candidatus Kapabacteria bacterium]